MRPSSFLSLALPALLLLGACRAEPVDPDGTPRGSAPAARLTGNQETDRATLQRLEKEASELARTEGCSSAGACRSIAVGAKACGGPRYYLPYCPVSTDEAALRAQLERLAAFERSYNERYGIASTCEMAMPPQLELSGGACVAAGRPTLQDPVGG